jgi:hypothetical protein
MINKYRILFAKLVGKRPLGITGHRWEDNIKVEFRRRDCNDMDWM